MTEIIEDDGTDGLEPDHWAGVFRFYDPRPQQELDRLQAEFFQRGGVATWLPPQEDRVARRHAPQAAYSEPRQRAESEKRKAAQRKADKPKVEKVELWLNNQEPGSRRHMAKCLGMADCTLARILEEYFKDDPRAAIYQYKGDSALRMEQEESDFKRKELIEYILSTGIRGITGIMAATGFTHNMVKRIVTKYNINVKPVRNPGHEPLLTKSAMDARPRLHGAESQLLQHS